MDCFKVFPIDRVREDALIEASYWKKLPWNQLLIVGAQLHIRQREWLAIRDSRKGNWLEATKKANHFTVAIGVLNQYLHTEVPAWMSEEANHYFSHCITNQ